MIRIRLVLFCRMEKYYAKKDVAASTQERRLDQKRPRIELDMNDIVADPGLRKPIDEFHPDIRDDARRAYIQMGPYQPNCEYERTSGKIQTRGFVKSWFTQFDWLEYSPAKDAAYCFYCYLFKPPVTSKFDNDAFTRVGFRNWKKRKDSLLKHCQSINGYHSAARKRSIDFKNQRQSVEHM